MSRESVQPRAELVARAVEGGPHEPSRCQEGVLAGGRAGAWQEKELCLRECSHEAIAKESESASMLLGGGGEREAREARGNRAPMRGPSRTLLTRPFSVISVGRGASGMSASRRHTLGEEARLYRGRPQLPPRMQCTFAHQN